MLTPQHILGAHFEIGQKMAIYRSFLDPAEVPEYEILSSEFLTSSKHIK